MEGLFYNTGNYHRTRMSDVFSFSRQYTDTINQGMLDDERIDNLHKKEEQEKEDQNKTQNPERPF
jgi:hypothetical protein